LISVKAHQHPRQQPKQSPSLLHRHPRLRDQARHSNGQRQWLTLVAPDAPDGVELLLEPTGHPASVAFQQALYRDGAPLT
jgi:hypothetical protein